MVVFGRCVELRLREEALSQHTTHHGDYEIIGLDRVSRFTHISTLRKENHVLHGCINGSRHSQT